MLLVSGISRKSIIALFLFLAVLSSGGYFILKDYQKDRITTFINPQNDPLGKGYNVIQSMVAVGSGGVFGKGLGHGSQSQLSFLPEKHNNFGYLIVVGVMAMIVIQVFINVGMNIGIAPVAGVPLPFVSYGGSSLVSILASLGLIQSVYVRRIKILDQ